MLYKPTAASRSIPNMPQYITAAIHTLYGARDDMALPLGAFFDTLDPETWLHVGGLWYTPVDIITYQRRELDQVLVEQFCDGIRTGQSFSLASGTTVVFELVALNIEENLPSIRDAIA